jgi:hypothetical protein
MAGLKNALEELVLEVYTQLRTRQTQSFALANACERFARMT